MKHLSLSFILAFSFFVIFSGEVWGVEISLPGSKLNCEKPTNLGHVNSGPPGQSTGTNISLTPNSGSCPGIASLPSSTLADSTFGPINVISGNKFKRQVDIAPLPGLLGLEFIRYYNSRFVINKHNGVGWTHSYSTRIVFQSGIKPADQAILNLMQADGRELVFSPSSDGILHKYYQMVLGMSGSVMV